MERLMDMDRYLSLSEPQRRIIRDWMIRESVGDATWLDPDGEGSVKVVRHAKSAPWVTVPCPFGKADCLSGEVIQVRHRVAVSTPPPWVSPTWSDEPGCQHSANEIRGPVAPDL